MIQPHASNGFLNDTIHPLSRRTEQCILAYEGDLDRLTLLESRDGIGRDFDKSVELSFANLIAPCDLLSVVKLELGRLF